MFAHAGSCTTQTSRQWTFPPLLAYFDLKHAGSEAETDVSHTAVQVSRDEYNLWASADDALSFWPTVVSFASLLRHGRLVAGLSNGDSDELCNF